MAENDNAMFAALLAQNGLNREDMSHMLYQGSKTAASAATLAVPVKQNDGPASGR